VKPNHMNKVVAGKANLADGRGDEPAKKVYALFLEGVFGEQGNAKMVGAYVFERIGITRLMFFYRVPPAIIDFQNQQDVWFISRKPAIKAFMVCVSGQHVAGSGSIGGGRGPEGRRRPQDHGRKRDHVDHQYGC